jgi:uncharacterized protein (DUF983 family)
LRCPTGLAATACPTSSSTDDEAHHEPPPAPALLVVVVVVVVVLGMGLGRPLVLELPASSMTVQ